jgi:hypothetical protein
MSVLDTVTIRCDGCGFEQKVDRQPRRATDMDWRDSTRDKPSTPRFDGLRPSSLTSSR